MSKTRAPLQWNPFAIANHNEWRLPRIVFHATHVAIGIITLWIGRCVHAPLWLIAVVAAAVAIYSKFVWIDWTRTSGRFFHPWVAYTLNAPDFIADVGFTLLGAIMPPAVWWLAYYPLSVVSDP